MPALFETILVKGGIAIALQEHFRRLNKSCLTFNMPCTVTEKEVVQYCKQLKGIHRLKIIQNFNHHKIESAPYKRPDTISLVISSYTVNSKDPLRQHKCVRREVEEAALKEAYIYGAFDAILCNEKGNIVEGARTNLFLYLEGELLTPPLSEGALPGCMRQWLLKNEPVSERVLSMDDLKRANSLLVTNSLIGVQPVKNILLDLSKINC